MKQSSPNNDPETLGYWKEISEETTFEEAIEESAKNDDQLFVIFDPKSSDDRAFYLARYLEKKEAVVCKDTKMHKETETWLSYEKSDSNGIPKSYMGFPWSSIENRSVRKINMNSGNFFKKTEVDYRDGGCYVGVYVGLAGSEIVRGTIDKSGSQLKINGAIINRLYGPINDSVDSPKDT